MPRIRTVLLSLLALALLPPAPVQAQSGWDVSVIGEVGYLIPTRTMGKNTGQLQQEQNIQIITEMDPAPTWAAGLAFEVPRYTMTVRGRFQTTIGGQAVGQAAVCELVTGSICQEVPIDVDMQSFIVDLRFVRGKEGDRVRPVLSGGLELRRFTFGDPLNCPLTDPSGWGPDICTAANEVYEDPQVSPGLVFGLGFLGELGPLDLTLNGQGQYSRYDGGVGDASGNTMIDASVTLAARIGLF